MSDFTIEDVLKKLHEKLYDVYDARELFIDNHDFDEKSHGRFDGQEEMLRFSINLIQKLK